MDIYQMTKDFTCQSLDRILTNYIEERTKSRQLRLPAFFTLSL